MKVKKTAKSALRMVKETLMPMGRSSLQASIAMKCRHQMEQKPKVKLPNTVQTAILDTVKDMRAWHINCVEVKAPRRETAIEAAMSTPSHWGSRRRGTAIPPFSLATTINSTRAACPALTLPSLLQVVVHGLGRPGHDGGGKKFEIE